jgi:hypothetical protein
MDERVELQEWEPEPVRENPSERGLAIPTG